MAIGSGNLFDLLPAQLDAEEIRTLVSTPGVAIPGVAIERIVSTGQASPPGFWYDAPRAEWVILLKGAAMLRFEDEAEPRRLALGDWLHIPARTRHRVEWTAAGEATVWLAVHFG